MNPRKGNGNPLFSSKKFLLYLIFSFGKASHDELSILAPIYQCCLMRFSTLQRLMTYGKTSPLLSQVLRHSMEKDPTDPVLTEKHLLALDRRVNIILKTVAKCITRNGHHTRVVVDDGF